MNELTHAELKVLRKADSIAIDYKKDGFDHGHTGQIRVIGDNHEASLVIPVPTRISSYGPLAREDVRHCYAHSGFGDYPEWQAIAWALKAGDRLSIRWLVDNDNGYIKESLYKGTTKIHCDYCYIQVQRASHTFRFLFDVRVVRKIS